MMYPRLFLARQLLTEGGIIFVSIDDHEVYNLRLMMNEIFGEENCIQQLVWHRRGGGGNMAKYCAINHEYILAYAKNLQVVDKLRRPLTKEEEAEYTEKDEHYPTLGPYKTRSFESQEQYGGYAGHQYEIEGPDGSTILGEWQWPKQRFLQSREKNKIAFTQDENNEWQVAYKLYRNESGRVLRSLLTDVEKNSHARAQLRQLFKTNDIFDYPKPVGLIKHLLQFSTNSDSIILDFFAGSCTTSQAVIELNQEDGGNRQFIMVQFPEPTPEKSTARNAGFETIAEIGKERIKRVCQNSAESPGFRVFKLSPSNYETESVPQTDDLQIHISELEETLDPLREGWSEGDVLYEIAIKEGYPLDSAVVRVEGLATNTVFQVTAPDETQTFHVCLDEKLTETDIERLGLSKDSVFVCRDIALNDTLAANLALQCRLKTI